VQASPKIMEVLNTAPLDIKDEDGQLFKLKKMRFNAAIAEAKERFNLFKKGQTKFSDLNESSQPKQTSHRVRRRERRCWINSSRFSPRQKTISTNKLRLEKDRPRISNAFVTNVSGSKLIWRFCGKGCPNESEECRLRV
jgi:hypothetical protein